MKLFIKSFVLVFGFVIAASMSFAADIKIVVAESLTGLIAKYGVPIKNGFTLAAEEINAAGGIGGNKINLVIEDEQGKK